jgi:hypothetical protein
MILNTLNIIYTVQWFTKDLCLPLEGLKNPLLLFKANDFKLYKKELKGKLGVYAFFCMTDGKYYIGSSVDLRSRLSQHLNYGSKYSSQLKGHEINNDCRDNKLMSQSFKFNSNKNLRAALIENGADDFYIMILDFIEPSQNDLLTLTTKELYNKLYNKLLETEDIYLQLVPKEKLYNIALNSINTSGPKGPIGTL